MAELLRIQRKALASVCFLGSKSMWHIYLGVGCWLLVLMAQLYGIRKYWGNVDAVAESIGVALLFAVVLVQSCYCITHKDQLQRIFDFLENMFYQFENEECREIVMKASVLTNKLTKGLVPLFAMDIFFWILVPFISYYIEDGKHQERVENEPFPYFCFVMDFPFDATLSPIFEVVFLLEMTCTVVFSMMNIGILKIVILTMLYTAAYLKAIAMMLRKLGDFEPNGKGIYKHAIEDHDAYLGSCIRLHQQLISFSRDLQQYISPILIFLLKLYELLLCIAVYEAALMTDRVSTFVISSIILLAKISVLCAFGEHLKEQSELLEKEVNACRWYEHSFSFRRNHLILLRQSQRNIMLHVGFFYPLTLETFIMILNTTYAYFNLLQQMR